MDTAAVQTDGQFSIDQGHNDMADQRIDHLVFSCDTDAVGIPQLCLSGKFPVLNWDTIQTLPETTLVNGSFFRYNGLDRICER